MNTELTARERQVSKALRKLHERQEAAAASSQHLALLIDADNASYRTLDLVMAEVATIGVASARRVYGDWTKPALSGWKVPLQQHAIVPIQQFTNTVGKNNTDSSMIIDAMDLLHSQRYEVFCLVTSDADFTRLATRIREDGKTVVGIGMKHTPQAFVAACDKFVSIETLQGLRGRSTSRERAFSAGERVAERSHLDSAAASPSRAESAISLEQCSSRQLEQLAMMRRHIDELAHEDGWTQLGDVGSAMKRLDPSFDQRDFGVRWLGGLIRSPLFTHSHDVEVRGSTMWVRAKAKAGSG